MSYKVLVLGPPVYKRAFADLTDDIEFLDGSNSLPVEITSDKVDLALFTGGADVSPHLYNESPNPLTRNNPQRDFREKTLFNVFKNQKIPMVGICRGAQFLNVMHGGSMHQHIHRHTQNHAMHLNVVLDGISSEIQVNSTHHQMMKIPKEAVLLAYANKVAFLTDELEPEVVFFPETRSLCVQYHPEMMHSDTDGYKYFTSLLKEFIYDAKV